MRARTRSVLKRKELVNGKSPNWVHNVLLIFWTMQSVGVHSCTATPACFTTHCRGGWHLLRQPECFPIVHATGRFCTITTQQEFTAVKGWTAGRPGPLLPSPLPNPRGLWWSLICLEERTYAYTGDMGLPLIGCNPTTSSNPITSQLSSDAALHRHTACCIISLCWCYNQQSPLLSFLTLWPDAWTAELELVADQLPPPRDLLPVHW